MGCKETNIYQALDKLRAIPGVTIVRTAKLYKTDPVGPVSQDWFLNTVAELQCTCDPWFLLQELQRIENDMGRVCLLYTSVTGVIILFPYATNPRWRESCHVIWEKQSKTTQ